METFNSNLYTHILPVVVTGILAIAGIIVKAMLSKVGNKLASREKTETINQDGSVTKREMEIYK